jgi:lipoate-protein ligase B
VNQTDSRIPAREDTVSLPAGVDPAPYELSAPSCLPNPQRSTPSRVETRWLGRRSYDQIHALQVQIRDDVAAGSRPPTLLLLEHEPVVTVGRRGELDDLKVSLEDLARVGVDFRRTERGGRATYHGPGQLVGYPIVPLRELGLDVTSYVCRVEEALNASAAALGVRAERRDGQPGLWVGDAKLASIGVAVSRGITWHGFALNVDPDLEAFRNIRPCGFDLPVTSIARCAGRAPDVARVAGLVADHFARVFSLELSGSAT